MATVCFSSCHAREVHKKKQRTETRLAADAALSSSPDPNFLDALAPRGDGPETSEQEVEEPSPADDDIEVSRSDDEQPSPADGGEPNSSDNEQPAEAAAQASSLAEDVMAGPSPFPPGDPVRLETAACLRRCMLDGTTPPAWVHQLVMPASARPVDGPTAAKMGELITSMADVEKAIESNLEAGRRRGNRVTFKKEPHGPAGKRGRSVSTDRSKSRKTTVAAGTESDYIMCRHRTSHSL